VVKKPVTEERTFCDFCEEPSYTECMLCDKDLCHEHRVEVVVYLNASDHCFRASLCRRDARWIEPFLKECQNKSLTWHRAGHNPEFNEARLKEVLGFIKWGPDKERGEIGSFIGTKND